MKLSRRCDRCGMGYMWDSYARSNYCYDCDPYCWVDIKERTKWMIGSLMFSLILSIVLLNLIFGR